MIVFNSLLLISAAICENMSKAFSTIYIGVVRLNSVGVSSSIFCGYPWTKAWCIELFCRSKDSPTARPSNQVAVLIPLRSYQVQNVLISKECTHEDRSEPRMSISGFVSEISENGRSTIVMSPASKKLTGHIGFGLSVHQCVRSWHFLMHAISYKPCMLGFSNFIYGFRMEK